MYIGICLHCSVVGSVITLSIAVRSCIAFIEPSVSRTRIIHQAEIIRTTTTGRHITPIQRIKSLQLWSTEDYLSTSMDFNVNDVSMQEETNFLDNNTFDEDSNGRDNDDEEEETNPILKFLKRIEETPRGQLHDNEMQEVESILLSSPISPDSSISNMDKNLPLIAERLLLRWVDEYKVRHCTIQPTTNTFLHVMQLWEKCIGSDRQHLNTEILPTSIEHIKMLLSLLKELHHTSTNENESQLLKPNIDIYRIVLRALAQSRERQIDRKGEKLFDEMQTDYNIIPDVSTYESLIYMLAKSRNDGAANRAERLLRDAITSLQKNSNDNAAMIGVDTFNVVITAWAKSGIDYGPERAEQIIHLMSDVNIDPNIHSFTSLIDAYAQSNTWDSANQCERIFNRVLDLYLNDGETSLEPNIVSWSVVVSAWGRLAKNGHRGASERADKILRRMETLHEQGRISYGPDPILYVKCMNANACSQTIEGLTRAKQIVEEMYERYIDGDDRFMPTARTIFILIDSWIRSQLPNKMDEAEAILNMYKDHLYSINDIPDNKSFLTSIYKSMVIGWAQDGDPILAQECLEEMMENDLIPESICFEKVIDSNTQINDTNSMKRSYAIFQLVEESRLKRNSVVPNERIYTAFIRSMTKAKVSNLAQKSYKILQRMEELYEQGNNDNIMPTIFTYNAVLLACAESVHTTDDNEQLRDAFRIAVTIFNDLRLCNKQCDLDNVSFGNMLRCSNLMPPDSIQKDEFIKSIYNLCCERGLVNYFILRDLYLVASDQLKEQLLGTCIPLNDINIDTFPSSWQRNVNTKPMNKPDSNTRIRDSPQRGKQRSSKSFQSKRR